MNKPPEQDQQAAQNDMDKYEEAIVDYTEAIKLKPDNPAAYYNRASTKSNLGRHDEAIEDYTEAIKLKPDNPAAYYNRASTKSQMAHEQAIEHYTKLKLKLTIQLPIAPASTRANGQA
ncbi:MAG: tetratricopeptide repeat protein [Candidatus Porifericomitaceae bacterium WSBS_2022_MAG_OTU9]